MALTVQDCLRLPTLKKAVVLGGKQGLKRPVEFVTVMEVTAQEDMVPDFFKKNQVAISSLAAIKHDVDAQCALLRTMTTYDTSGLILFQCGQNLPQLDKRFIETADELNFPLISVAMEHYEILYTDIIHDITGLIFRTQLSNQLFTPELFDNLNRLISGGGDANYLLQILAENLDGMLLLLNRNLQVLALSHLPHSLHNICANPEHGSIEVIVELARSALEQAGGNQYVKNKFTLHKDEHLLQMYSDPIGDKHGNNLYLWLITASNANFDIIQRQIASIVTAYMNGRNNNTYGSNELLLSAILQRRHEQQRYFSANLGLDLSNVGVAWFIKSTHGLSPYTLPFNSNDYGSPPVLSGMYQDSHIILLPRPSPEQDVMESVEALLNTTNHTPEGLKHFIHTTVNDMDDIAGFYELVDQNCQAAAIIYPHRHVFTQPKMFFVHTIQKLHKAGNEETALWLSALKPLRQDEDLLRLLEAMLLDTNMNVYESTQLLYIHKNTVYYRLKKIRSLLGFDPFDQPANHNLAIALAIRRLILSF